MVADCDVIADEVSVQMKPPDRSAILMIEGYGSSEGGHNSHYVIQITKESPFKQWIFDITGPQLNIFYPCLDLPTYLARYVDRFRLTAPLGTARILFENLADTEGMAGLEARIDRDAVKALEKGIQEWQTRSSSSIAELLRKPESIFMRRQEEVLAVIQESLDEFVLSAHHMLQLSPGKQSTTADSSSAHEAAISVFGKHERYLRQFID